MGQGLEDSRVWPLPTVPNILKAVEASLSAKHAVGLGHIVFVGLRLGDLNVLVCAAENFWAESSRRGSWAVGRWLRCGTSCRT